MKVEASNYSWALDHIFELDLETEIKVVAEIGSRDAIDAIYLQETLSCDVHVFEADPFNAVFCRQNIENSKQQTHLHFYELALSNQNGEIDFFSVDIEKYDNIGSSSMYPISFRGRPRSDPDKNRDSVQKTVRVNASRFDSLEIPTPDLIAMDTEGSELKILMGFGPSIKQVKFIILETSFWNNFQNHKDVSTFPEIHRLLERYGFQFLASNQDKKNEFPKRSIRRTILNRHQPNFDVLYVNKELL
jgi:FkbM family methyltransferase